MGVPLVLPLAILVFLGAFFPLVGAFLSGLVAVAVALVNGGWTDALIVFAIVLGGISSRRWRSSPSPRTCERTDRD